MVYDAPKQEWILTECTWLYDAKVMPCRTAASCRVALCIRTRSLPHVALHLNRPCQCSLSNNVGCHPCSCGQSRDWRHTAEYGCKHISANPERSASSGLSRVKVILAEDTAGWSKTRAAMACTWWLSVTHLSCIDKQHLSTFTCSWQLSIVRMGLAEDAAGCYKSSSVSLFKFYHSAVTKSSTVVITEWQHSVLRFWVLLLCL